MKKTLPIIFIALLIALLSFATQGASFTNNDLEGLEFEDGPRVRDLPHPEWFKLSFLNLREDLAEAVHAGKQGLIIYYGQKHCAYCTALIRNNFGRKDIEDYTNRHFDVVAIDIWGDREVTDINGRVLSEKAMAVMEKATFTPSLVFYDQEGREALRLPGYYPPYQFLAALEYVADGHYRQESFRDYLARADPPLAFEPDGLNQNDFFGSPPYYLDRRHFPNARPLVVFFEQGKCHACDILHTGPLHDSQVLQILDGFDAVQLDITAETPLITPDGKRTTARRWASELGLFYAPSLLFFASDGQEIIRIDSVIQIYRLNAVLNYVASGDYRQEPNFQRWREDYTQRILAR